MSNKIDRPLLNQLPSFLSNLNQLAEQKTACFSLPSYLYATDDGDIITVGLFHKIIEEFREKVLKCTNRTSLEVVGNRVLTILKTNKKYLDPQKISLISHIATKRKLTANRTFAEALKARSDKIFNKITKLDVLDPSAEINQTVVENPLAKDEVSDSHAVSQEVRESQEPSWNADQALIEVKDKIVFLPAETNEDVDALDLSAQNEINSEKFEEEKASQEESPLNNLADNKEESLKETVMDFLKNDQPLDLEEEGDSISSSNVLVIGNREIDGNNLAEAPQVEAAPRSIIKYLDILAGGALVGAPIAHDLLAISFSDSGRGWQDPETLEMLFEQTYQCRGSPYSVYTKWGELTGNYPCGLEVRDFYSNCQLTATIIGIAAGTYFAGRVATKAVQKLMSKKQSHQLPLQVSSEQKKDSLENKEASSHSSVIIDNVSEDVNDATIPTKETKKTVSSSRKAAKIAFIAGSAALSALAFYEYLNTGFKYSFGVSCINGACNQTETTQCIGNWYPIHNFVTGGSECLPEMGEWHSSYKNKMSTLAVASALASIGMLKNLLTSK